MRLLLCSTADGASVNIRDRLVEMGGWEDAGSFRGHALSKRAGDLLATIDEVHLHADFIDDQVRKEAGVSIDRVVFLSRHRAASGIPTLTVHPIGNFGKAEYGGREGTLVPAGPEMMTSTLRSLQAKARGLPFQVGFEVTHHGPYLETPTMFIEIGSDESNWGNRDAARAIAEALLGTEEQKAPRAIGIGGGHYAPRFSEAILTKRVAFGHMIPNHFLEGASDEEARNAISMALEKSGGAKLAYIHRKSMARSRATRLKGTVESLGAEAIDSSDLEDLQA